MGEAAEKRALVLIQPGTVPEDLKSLSSYITHFQQCAADPSLSPDHQFNASLLWLLTAREHNDPTLLLAYQHIASTFDQLGLLGFDLWARQRILDRLPTDLATSAARCAIQHNRLELAVSLLDKCRGLSWRQMLRTLPSTDEIDHLVESYPGLGVPLRGYLRALHIGSMSNRAKSNRSQEITQQEIDAHLEIARDTASLIAQVRKSVPGYEDFMNPDPIKHARTLAQAAPVVVLVPDTASTHIVVLRKGAVDFEYRCVEGLGTEVLQDMAKKIKDAISASGRLARGPNAEEAGGLYNNVNDVSSEAPTERKFAPKPFKRSDETTQDELNHLLSTLWSTIGIAMKDFLSLQASQLHKSGDIKK
ncbi:hypothetical protein RhiLY_11752 [Ceratobasidium sp. AG-Ba]|nr:hypothetical protein RhiLY_11752 [Ceratobasidium sp. AG-Ba]